MSEGTTPEYPKRERFFSHRLVRLLTKSAAAQDLGPEACWLLTIIAHQEDAKRYSGAVTFYNEQLMPLCGFGGKDRLVGARNRAVAHGWLHYEEGAKRRPGKYWTLIPEAFLDLPDVAMDESSDPNCRPESGRESGQHNALPSQNRTENGRKTDRNRTANPPLSSLPRDPDPSPEDSSCPGRAPDEPPAERRAPVYTEEDMALASWMFGLIRELNPGHKEPNLRNWANEIRLIRERDNRSHDDIRELFRWANADPFWRSNILSPSKLRAKWDQLNIKKQQGANENVRVLPRKRTAQPIGPGHRHGANGQRVDVGSFSR